MVARSWEMWCESGVQSGNEGKKVWPSRSGWMGEYNIRGMEIGLTDVRTFRPQSTLSLSFCCDLTIWLASGVET